MMDLTAAIPALVVLLFVLRAVVLLPVEFTMWRIARTDEESDKSGDYLYAEYARRVLGPHMLNIPAVFIVCFVASYSRSFDLCDGSSGVNVCALDPGYGIVASIVGIIVSGLMTAALLASTTLIIYGLMRDVQSLRLAREQMMAYFERHRLTQPN